MSDDQPMLSPTEPGSAGAFEGGPRRPSATAIRPRGILKNAPSRQVSVDAQSLPTLGNSAEGQLEPGTEQHRLQWDEGNLALHDYEREQTTRMTIDEPKTPFVSSSNLVAEDDVPWAFSLDESGSSTASSWFPGAGGGIGGPPSISSSSANGSGSGSRRGSSASSAEITARNTLANAQLGRRSSGASVGGAAGSQEGPASSSGSGLGLLDGSAVESMAVDELEGGGTCSVGGSAVARAGGGLAAPTEDGGMLRSRTNSSSSRSPSFSLPRAGSGGLDARDALRAERDMDTDGQDEIEEDEEDEETKAKHAAFAAKRNQHYGNEADAMRVAAALAAQEDDEDEDEEDEEGEGEGVRTIPPLPRINGNA
ncbi:hypothetical protein V8E36_006110 [Tilletia maclaganii]